MRPTLYGKQIVIASDGRFVGVNVGYNFYNEHECGTTNLVYGLNMNRPSEMLELEQAKSILEMKKVLRKVEKRRKVAEKDLKRWKNTPFDGCVCLSTVPYLKRKVIIDNSSIRDKYSRFITMDGEYTLLYIGSHLNKNSWHKRFGDRRKFSEEELFYMQDYNHTGVNTGVFLAQMMGTFPSFQSNGGTHMIAGSWADDGVLLMTCDAYVSESIIDSVIKALESGNLAIVDNESRLFKDRGCCLIDLESAYRPNGR